MTNPNQAKVRIPEAALYALATEREYPDAGLLEQVIRQYPGYAEALTTLAIELAVDALTPVADIVQEDDQEAIAPAVSRAMSRFENALFQEEVQSTGGAPFETKSAIAVATPVNPFSGLERPDVREYAKRIGANTLFVAKLRDREIDETTYTAGFIKHAADKLPVDPSVMAAHLAAGSIASAPALFHKAEEKPVAGQKQSFEEAVRSSGLSRDQQKHLLGL
ncbi:hypothetical protein [uncultured Tateyamaria sp.]|uniref:hypothetical protein n=1 Tax=uncultured Tateyamaria sp. TaxID=455651 RepID=UPI00262F8E31|nr:hypothetical protein [uncultured Tateyamaria sp.]